MYVPHDSKLALITNMFPKLFFLLASCCGLFKALQNGGNEIFADSATESIQ